MPKILIADDDFSIGMENEEMLIALGYDVVGQAGSGRQAVEMARDHKPDIILMDVLMPGEMNGIDAAERIKAELDIPIVFISGYGDPEYIERAKKLEPFGYVMKPFDAEEIRAFIEIALHKKAMELKLRKANDQLNHANHKLKQEIRERKEAEKELRRKNEYLDVLHEISIGLIKRQNLTELLEAIVFRAAGLVGTQHGCIHIYNPDRDELEFRIGIGHVREGLGFKLKPGEGIAGRSWKTKQPVIIDDYSIWEGRIDTELSKRVRACISIPLKSGAGVITLGCLDEGIGKFGTDEIDVLNRFSDIASIALDNARLYEKFMDELAERRNAEKELQKTHDKLEQRVEERTAELVEANEQLQQEIIERKHAKELLRESEEYYRSIMEAMKDPTYICSQDYRIEYMNPAMIKRTGRAAIGEHCFKALHNLEEKCPWCMRDKAPSESDGCTESEIISPKDNRSYHISRSPIVHGDGSISQLSIFRDTTELKKTEARLQQALKMEAIGTLAGGIAHDFNNVLYAIMGYTDLTIDLVPEGSKAQRNLQQVMKGADRAKEMVQQILSFSRQSKKEKNPTDIQSIVKEAMKLLGTSLPSTIEIRQHMDADCGLVMADPTHIHQAIMNLATNAYHAMREKGGILEVNLQCVEWGLRNGDLKENEAKTKIEDTDIPPGFYLKLTVEDTGHGIDSSVMERIFEPYFTTKGVGEGTGMGLAVVYGIARDHGGDIRVSSEPGKGTAFHLYLPLIEPGIAERKIISSEEQAPTGTERILFVDDEELVVNIAREMLKSLGYHVTTHTGSVEALEAFGAKPDEFDLVITDMTMPNMTGAELAPRLLKIRPNIPIILCTGFSELMDEDRAKAIGIRQYIMKPVLIKEMAEAIRNVLEKPNAN